ncbi:MAG: rod shape-determining protein MreD [Turicibacter sp.]
MIRLILVFVTCFVMDNLLVNFLPIQPIFSHYIAIPDVFLSCLIMFIFFDKDRKVIWLAFIFGMLYDVSYADLFGLYTFIFPTLTFIIQRLLSQTMPVNIFSMLALLTIAIISEEWLVYFVVDTMKVTNMPLSSFLGSILIPTVLFNAGLFFITYPILKIQFKKYVHKLERS